VRSKLSTNYVDGVFNHNVRYTFFKRFKINDTQSRHEKDVHDLLYDSYRYASLKVEYTLQHNDAVSSQQPSHLFTLNAVHWKNNERMCRGTWTSVVARQRKANGLP